MTNAMIRTRGTTLITGASQGIGRELALLLAAEGHALVLVARNEARLLALAAQIRSTHAVAVTTVALDLAAPDAARTLFERTRGTVIETLVNNAGVGIYGEHTELAPDRLDQMLRLNITTLSELCLLYGAEMKTRRSGKILNIASTAAYQPTPWFAAYGASKAFVLNFSEALAMELRDHGVTVSCLSPGPTDTGFFGEIDAAGVANPHFEKSGRDDVRKVAQIGVDMLATGQLSRIVGAKNKLRAWSARIATRAMVARISRGVMRAN